MLRFQLPSPGAPGAAPNTAPRRLAGIAVLLTALSGAVPAHAAGGTLQIFPDLPLMLVLIVVFAVLVWPANALLWAPVLRVIDERRARIDGTRARASEVAAEADTVLARYEAAVGQARGEAETTRREALDVVRRESSQVGSEARGLAEEEVTRARGEVAEALQRARAELRGHAETLAREAAAQVLGRPLS